MTIRRLILCFLLMTVIGGGIYLPEAKAIDPITMAILAPAAVAAAKIAAPYVIRGFFSGMKGFLKVGMDMFEILKLPAGLLGCTIGAPFGFFDSGVNMVVDGAVAPFKMCWHVVMLPVMFCGIDVK